MVSLALPTTFSTTAILAAVLYLAYRFVVHPALISPLSRIPKAHWSASLSPAWILYIRFTGRENRTLLEAHRRLGPVVRVAPNELSIDDIDAVRTVYGGGFDKTSWYSVFDNYGVPCMFSTRASRDHSLRKRMISNVYSKSYIQSSESFKAQARAILFDRLLPTLVHSASESQVPHGVDVLSLFLATTMDFISAYVFGLQNGANFIKDAAYREHWLHLYKSRIDHGFFPQEFPRLTSLLRKIGLQPYPTWVDSANREMGEWNTRMCEGAIELNTASENDAVKPGDEPLVLQTLLAGLHKEEMINGKDSILYSTAIRHHNLSVCSELIDHTLAGHETAGITLTYLAWHLSKRQDVQRTLQAELRSLKPHMFIHGNNGSSLPEAQSLDSLPSLHAVVMETLRLHAPLPGPQPRQSPHPSCQIGPYRVPGGVRIAALAFTLHRHERIFPDPEKWDHTRWIGSGGDIEAGKERNKQFWAFSSGGRMCIGSNFAMHEMKLIVAAIYSNFTTHIVDDSGIEQTDGYAGRPASERLYLRFEPIS